MRAMLRSSSYTNLKIEEKSSQQPEFKLSEIRKKKLNPKPTDRKKY